MAMVTILIEAWRNASQAATTTAALETLAETAKRGLRAASAVLELATIAGARREPQTGDTHTLEIPVLGLRGQVIANLGVVRAADDAAFTAEDRALGQALVAGMVHFARRMEITLLAEGVETDAERATLLRLGVTRGQGYLFGHPAPAEALSAGLIGRTSSR